MTNKPKIEDAALAALNERNEGLDARNESFARLAEIPIAEVGKLFDPDSVATLSDMKATQRSDYENLLQRLTSDGFTRVPELDKTVDRATVVSKAAKTRKTKKAEASAAWPRDLDYQTVNPARVARQFAAARPGRIINSDGEFYQLDDSGLWTPLTVGALRAEIRATDPADKLEPKHISAAVNGIADLRTANARPFEWIDPPANAPDPRDLILFRNGLLNVKTGDLLPLDGAYFATATPNYDYDPDAQCPLFEEYIAGRLEASFIPALQEMMGHFLVPDATPHRYWVFVGAPRSGKSTIKDLIEQSIGTAHCVAKNLSDLTQTFGLQEIVSARLMVLPDARDVSGPSRNAVIERLLALTGGDRMSFPRKYKDAIDCQPVARALIVCNQQLSFLDNSGAIAARQICFVFSSSFEGKEDMTIPDKLAAELPGIANWAIKGLKRLRANNYNFTIGKHSKAEKASLKRRLSPIVRFAEDQLIITNGEGHSTQLSKLYDAFRAWAVSEGLSHSETYAKQTFAANLRAAFPQVEAVKKRLKTLDGRGTRQAWVQTNVQLTEQAEDDLRRDHIPSRLIPEPWEMLGEEAETETESAD